MDIVVNGRPQSAPDGLSIAALVGTLGIEGRYAVELNEAVLPRSRHAETLIKPGDRIEIVRAIGGG